MLRKLWGVIWDIPFWDVEVLSLLKLNAYWSIKYDCSYWYTSHSDTFQPITVTFVYKSFTHSIVNNCWTISINLSLHSHYTFLTKDLSDHFTFGLYESDVLSVSTFKVKVLRDPFERTPTCVAIKCNNKSNIWEWNLPLVSDTFVKNTQEWQAGSQPERSERQLKCLSMSYGDQSVRGVLLERCLAESFAGNNSDVFRLTNCLVLGPMTR